MYSEKYKRLIILIFWFPVIFGTRNNSCKVVAPGPAIGESCVFPFTWLQTSYNACAYDPTSDDWPWCSTLVDQNGLHVSNRDKHGKCDLNNCPILGLESVEISSSGDGGVDQKGRMGTYIKSSQESQGFPVYQQKVKKSFRGEFLFVDPKGHWRVGPDITTWKGSGLKNEKNSASPPQTGWMYWKDGWINDDSIRAVQGFQSDNQDSQELNIRKTTGSDGGSTGLCLNSDGKFQTKGLRTLSRTDKEHCYSQCTSQEDATGCQWRNTKHWRTKRACVVHTMDVRRGSGNGNAYSSEFYCWSFHPDAKGYSGRCLTTDGEDQNEGVQYLRKSNKRECYDQCKNVSSATGCQWHFENKTCIAHTLDVAKGSSEDDGDYCWVFGTGKGGLEIHGPDVLSMGTMKEYACTLKNYPQVKILAQVTDQNNTKVETAKKNNNTIEVRAKETDVELTITCSAFGTKISKSIYIGHKDCFQRNKISGTGTDYYSQKATSSRECQEKCQKSATCTWFDWSSRSQVCKLLEKKQKCHRSNRLGYRTQNLPRK